MNRRIAAITVMIVAATAMAWADTLVLTNGRRVQGELIGVSGRDIEFEERSGFNRRVVRIPRRDIARIEFDENGSQFSDDRRDDRRDNVPPVLNGEIPRGMRERQVNVTAREQWSDTGVDVRAGQLIYFRTTGETRWGPNRRDGAAGERNSPYNAGRPLPDRPAAALIGRIGERDVIFIGDDQMPFRVRSNGRLYLGINDDVLTDNTGALRVTILY
jgi:hypothetical protein